MCFILVYVKQGRIQDFSLGVTTLKEVLTSDAGAFGKKCAKTKELGWVWGVPGFANETGMWTCEKRFVTSYLAS